MKIKIHYQTYLSFLSENEWVNLIKEYLNIINKTNVGSILLEEIDTFINSDFEVIIQNYSSDKTFQYPSCKKFQNKIVIYIPDTPYFIKVPVLDLKLNKLKNVDSNLQKMRLNQPIQQKLNLNEIKHLYKYEFQPVVVILFHELVHCLRTMYNYQSDTEEESTIYGLIGDTLICKNKIITENSFRKELYLGSRISHSSEYYYVYGTNNDKNIKKETLKSYFKKIKLMI